MKNKKIKTSLRRKSRRKKNLIIKKMIMILSAILFVVSANKINNYITTNYGKVSDSENVSIYIDVADNLSKGKAQVNWKEIMAIGYADMNGDLEQIRKKDLIDIGEKFLVEVDKENEIYKVNSLEEVMNKMGFDKEKKNKAYDKLKKLELEQSNENKLTSEKIDFIKKLEKESIELYQKHKILPSITIGQAILESGWGQSMLTKKSNNLYGIKADKRWDGDEVSIDTKENYNDKIVASFRSYSSIKDSIKDYGKFLSENERYSKNGLFEGKDYMAQAEALERAGYSTKKDKLGNLVYADMLIDLIRNYNLQLIDTKVNRNV